jgi:hypothetical protein
VFMQQISSQHRCQGVKICLLVGQNDLHWGNYNAAIRE